MDDRYFLDILTLKTEMQFREYSESTQKTYTRTVRNFLKYIDKDIINIRKQDVIKYLDFRSKEVTVNSVLVELNALEFFFNEILGLDITDNIRKFKRAINKKYLMTTDQIMLLINCVSLRDRIIYEIVMETGMEVDEIAELNVTDIHYLGQKGLINNIEISEELTKKIIRYIDKHEITGKIIKINGQGIRAMNRKKCMKYLGEIYTFRDIKRTVAYEMLKRGEIEKATKYLRCKETRILKQYYRNMGYQF